MSITREEFEKAKFVSQEIPLLQFLSKHLDDAFSIKELMLNHGIEIGMNQLVYMLRENYIQTAWIKDKIYVAITEKGRESVK